MEKLKIANLPTRIEKLEKISNELDTNLYVKRDDFTGTEYSGNKIRKLEYALAEAVKTGCDTIITAGATQSNHCRATAAACAKYGLKCELVIRGEEPEQIEGNLFLDYVLGANVNLIKPEDSREDKMNEISERIESTGGKAYLIPVGASNAVGSLGYLECFEEILNQEKELGIIFDAIVLSVGSGGTYAGLWLGNYLNKSEKLVYGISVSDSSEEFKEQITDILKNMDGMDADDDYLGKNIVINDKYIGEGYAKSTDEELKFLVEVAQSEGIIFDPCYTGKAFKGCYNEIKEGDLRTAKNILFIHTGGLMGWTMEQRNRVMEMLER
ncbi:D-cysteine desulfhydrase family protein [Microaceticoccus formicicus]|uniref:D-cysteine desulfhydrase family protein n=1 Tax=Microaceticoccus formicicus TaxID=3118105 RepID=UPI003CD03559|nr:D-cysteine desulfhydrase family protein [Peptoniphilaceae bacterium AMB_02]